MKQIKIAIAIACTALLTGCVEEYKTTSVQGEVTHKEHDEAERYYKTITDSDGNKKKKLVTKDEEFEVNIRYKDIEKEFEFDNDDFFDDVRVGDKVPIQLITGYDKDGNIVTQDIELPSN